MKFVALLLFVVMFTFALGRTMVKRNTKETIQVNGQENASQNAAVDGRNLSLLDQLDLGANPFTLRDAQEIQQRLKNIPVETTNVTQ